MEADFLEQCRLRGLARWGNLLPDAAEPDPAPAVDPQLACLVDAAFERALASQATAIAVTRHRLPDAGAVLARRRQQLASREVA